MIQYVRITDNKHRTTELTVLKIDETRVMQTTDYVLPIRLTGLHHRK